MLTPEEIQELEATLLPALERHHLRLLAHGLRTLQQIAGSVAGAVPGTPPEPSRIRAWALAQAAIGDDPTFVEAFCAQLHGVGQQLQAIAGAERQALDLELADLIRWARQQADQRIAAGPSSRAD